MNTTQQTATPSAPASATPAPSPPPNAARHARLPALRLHPRHLALAAVLALSAVLNVNRLSQNGYANTFYSAAVKSMLRSLHNFVFVSFDTGGLISVDKPPIALWVQTASAKLFGFSPLSLLLPEAIAGVLAVAVLYHLLNRRLGAVAGIVGALTMAVFPSFVAVSRENGVDPVLILLMVLACAAGLRAIDNGRLRTLLLCGVLVGLAFNTKTLAAYLVVPGIALAYIVCAPGSISRRAISLLTAGLAMALVSFSWIAFVDHTPASQRPYVGSSTNNSELGLTFGYNGLGRVEGQAGGPGRTPVKPGALAHVQLVPGAQPPPPAPGSRRRAGGAHPRPSRISRAPAKLSVKTPSTETTLPAPIPFGGPVGPLRLFGVGLGDQGAWMLPFAFFGLMALVLLLLGGFSRLGAATGSGSPQPTKQAPAQEGVTRGPPAPASDGERRRDPALAVTLMFGSWFLTEAAVLSFSKGIVHPYYVSALAPATGAMAGGGAAALIELARARQAHWRLLIAPCAIAATVVAQVLLLDREHYMEWFIPVLIVGAAVGLAALLLATLLSARKLAAPAMLLTLGLLLATPTAYSSTTWHAPVEGTFPAAGPHAAPGAGGVGVPADHLRTYLALLHYVSAHRPGSRWAVLTDAATTAAPFILLDLNAGSLAGYSGTDPAIDGPGLAHLVARKLARYVVLGGEFSTRGGNRATAAVLRACAQLPPNAWHDPNISADGLVLFDCAGRERQLAAE